MKPIFIPIVLALAAAGGCISEPQHVHRRPVEPPPTVIVAPRQVPPPRYEVRQPHRDGHGPRHRQEQVISENDAIRIARSEANRRGWRGAEVHRAGYWNDRWHIDLHHQPRRGPEKHGWVEIAANGKVLEFSQSRRDQAHWEGRPSRDFRRR